MEESKILCVGAALQQSKGFVANRHALAAGVAVAVVIAHTGVGAEVDDGLAFFVAGADLALPGLHGDGAELDALDGLPGLRLEFDQFDAVEAGIFEGFEEALLGEGTGDAAAPEGGVVHEVLRDRLVSDDVGDDGAAAFFQHAEEFLKEAGLFLGFDEVEHAVGDHHVDGIVGHQRLLGAQVGGEVFDGEIVAGGVGWQFAHGGVEGFEVEAQVLDAALAELGVGESDTIGHHRRVAAGDFEHVVGHIDPDDAALGANHLRGDEADLPGAGAEVEHGLAGLEPLGGVAAAVVLFNDFVGNDFEPFAVVFDRAAERGFRCFGSIGVAGFDTGAGGGGGSHGVVDPPSLSLSGRLGRDVVVEWWRVGVVAMVR